MVHVLFWWILNITFKYPLEILWPDSWVSFKIRTFHNTKARSHPLRWSIQSADLNISEQSEKETNLNINKHLPPVNTLNTLKTSKQFWANWYQDVSRCITSPPMFWHIKKHILKSPPSMGPLLQSCLPMPLWGPGKRKGSPGTHHRPELHRRSFSGARSPQRTCGAAEVDSRWTMTGPWWAQQILCWEMELMEWDDC